MSSNLFNPTGFALEQNLIRESLERVIRSMATDCALYDDLMQEAMIHLWLTESRRPGQTPSWYLQSCKFHLQHYLASGRSVDSTKRRSGQLQFGADSEEEDGIPEQADMSNSVITSVSARELLELLASMLSAQENAVLDCLADGLGAREIGRELKISHTMVIKHRRKIAALLEKLDRPERKVQGRVNSRGNGHLSSNGHVNGKHHVNGNGKGRLNANGSKFAGMEKHAKTATAAPLSNHEIVREAA